MEGSGSDTEALMPAAMRMFLEYIWEVLPKIRCLNLALDLILEIRTWP